MQIIQIEKRGLYFRLIHASKAEYFIYVSDHSNGELLDENNGRVTWKFPSEKILKGLADKFQVSVDEIRDLERHPWFQLRAGTTQENRAAFLAAVVARTTILRK